MTLNWLCIFKLFSGRGFVLFVLPQLLQLGLQGPDHHLQLCNLRCGEEFGQLLVRRGDPLAGGLPVPSVALPLLSHLLDNHSQEKRN